MADEPDEEVTEDVEPEVQDTSDESWNRMKSLISEVLDEKLSTWQPKLPAAPKSSPNSASTPPPTRQDKPKNNGFLGDWF